MADEDEIEGMESSAEDIETEMSLDEFGGRKFLKNPEVGQEIEFVIEKIMNNKKTTGKNKEGVEFDVGRDFLRRIGRYSVFALHTVDSLNHIGLDSDFADE